MLGRGPIPMLPPPASRAAAARSAEGMAFASAMIENQRAHDPGRKRRDRPAIRGEEVKEFCNPNSHIKNLRTNFLLINFPEFLDYLVEVGISAIRWVRPLMLYCLGYLEGPTAPS